MAAGKFANISGSGGFDLPDDGRSIATADWDQDGDIDLWISNRNAPRLRFMRNNSSNPSQSLALRLVGDGKHTNRDAIGARIEVYLNRKKNQPATPQPKFVPDSDRLLKTIRAGEGFLSQSSKWAHFGIPKTMEIEKVVVRWPGGGTEVFSNIDAGNRYVLAQHAGSAKSIQRPERKIALKTGVQKQNQRGDITFRMPVRAEVPPLFFEDWKGKKQLIIPNGKKNLLILFWASWCPSCLLELKEFADFEDQIRAANLNVLALSVDGLEGSPLTESEARRLLNTMNFPFASGRANRELIGQLQSINILKTENGEIPLPFSFLLDDSNRLIEFHRGPVRIQNILEANHTEDADIVSRFEQASTLGGISLSDSVARDALERAEATGRLDYGRKLEDAGLFDRAIHQYKRILDISPDSEEALIHLAVAHSKAGDLATAEKHFDKILKLNPDSAISRANLGGIYLTRKQYARAKNEFDKAIKLSADDPQLYFQRAMAEINLDQMEQSLEDLNRAIFLQPDFLNAHFQRGLCLLKLNKIKMSLSDFDIVIVKNPSFIPAYKGRGIAKLQLGMYEDSIIDLTTALERSPSDLELYNNRGLAYSALGYFAFAIADFEQALEINSEKDPGVLNNLAWLLATCSKSEFRNGDLALKYATRSCEQSNWGNYGALDTLAAANAELGRFSAAIKWQKKAISNAPEEVKAELRERLDLYKRKKPFRAISKNSQAQK
tara:strand:+ start:714 stop:2879 length:2166 start_codon:yes stop_codon:yes gene_type:complete